MRKIALIFTILISIILRFYQLGQNPPALYWDEIALGYNAYSVAETLSDEEGVFLPYQYFRSFGDFKPPVYIYAAVPMIKILGLNEWTTRFPSAFFGTLSVFLTYLLTKQILKRLAKKQKDSDNQLNYFLDQSRIQWISILASFLLAISPWHTQISRVAYEANIALFLTILAVYFFYLALDSQRQKHKYIFFSLSSISFVLTIYTFNSNRVFEPLLVLSLGIIYLKELFSKQYRNIKPIIFASALGLLLFLPIVPHLASDQAKIRYKEVNIFSDPQPVVVSNARIERLDNTWWAGVINNRRILYLQLWLDGYFRHFTGKFLFISGDGNPRFSLQDVGQLYLVEAPFLLAGLYLFAKRYRKETALILAWMLIGPIPAAFAREVPHALRSLNILPTFQIITAFGFVYIVYRIGQVTTKKLVIRNSVLAISAAAIFFNAYYYLHNYYVHYPRYSQSEWQYGYKPMVEKLKQIQDQYDRIVITDGLGRPYINTLFYLQHPPALFQKERQATTDHTGFGFVTVNQFNKYEFRGISWKKEITNQEADEKVLLVGNDKELVENKYTKAVIRNLDGQIVFILNELPTGIEALYEINN